MNPGRDCPSMPSWWSVPKKLYQLDVHSVRGSGRTRASASRREYPPELKDQMNRKCNRLLSPSPWVDYHYTLVSRKGQIDLNEPMIESFAMSCSDSRRRPLCRTGAYSLVARQGCT